MSTANATYQRPHGSLQIVTVAGSIVVGSMPGQDQMNASGVPIFARNRRPSRHRNPDRVYSAHCLRFSTWACSWSGYARHLYAVLTVRNFIRLNSDM